jgi:hypothetical protein
MISIYQNIKPDPANPASVHQYFQHDLSSSIPFFLPTQSIQSIQSIQSRLHFAFETYNSAIHLVLFNFHPDGFRFHWTNVADTPFVRFATLLHVADTIESAAPFILTHHQILSIHVT